MSPVTSTIVSSTDASRQQQQRQESLQERINALRVAHQELITTTTTTTAAASAPTPPHSLLHDDTKNSSINQRNENIHMNKNQVYIQLSSGSVAILTDRTIAKARVSRQLQTACDELDSLQQHNP